MKRIAICTIVFFLSCTENKDPEKDKKPATTTAIETEKKADPAEYFIPGPMHQWLASFTGTWEADVISYMDPTKPDTSKLTQTYSMILNGLYQEAKLRGTMMGMPFEGRSINAYDNARKKFQTTWMDIFSSGFTYMTGDYDSTSKTLNLKGTQPNPSDGTDMNIRQVMKMIDKDTYTLTMYGDGPGGKEIKFMQGTFKRKT
ncbi:MAG TPA: DUF1579 domain-containing protein [Chitinophagaceae bacterium]|nr:DUF1579 domain-containing protein [Chitinophagaceae bacterium]